MKKLAPFGVASLGVPGLTFGRHDRLFSLCSFAAILCCGYPHSDPARMSEETISEVSHIYGEKSGVADVVDQPDKGRHGRRRRDHRPGYRLSVENGGGVRNWNCTLFVPLLRLLFFSEFIHTFSMLRLRKRADMGNAPERWEGERVGRIVADETWAERKRLWQNH